MSDVRFPPSARPKPLAGIRIIDFTLHAAGPFGTHFLTLLGAECIRVESVQRLDIARRPHPVYGRFDLSTFDQANAGKLGITLNLKDPRGKALARQLIAVSDVVAESFRPGVMARLGLDYESLKGTRNDIIMVSVSNSGQFGPESSSPGYAPIFAALGSLGHLTGYADGPPTELRNMMDNVTGLNAAFAVVVALEHRRRTGRGAHVDVSAREVASCFAGDAVLAASAGVTVSRQGNVMSGLAPYGVFPCSGSDQWISIAITSAAQWRELIDVLGIADRFTGDIYDKPEPRWECREEIDRIVATATSTWNADDLTVALQARSVPAYPSVNAAELTSDRHLRERGVIIDLSAVTGDDRDDRAVVGPFMRFSKSAAALERTSPAMGEHNQYVFGELLGLSESSICDLVADKVIA